MCCLMFQIEQVRTSNINVIWLSYRTCTMLCVFLWYLLPLCCLQFLKVDSYVYIEGNYIGITTGSVNYNWSTAETYCVSTYGTSLASIHSASQQAVAESVMYKINATFPFIGLHDLNTEGSYEWTDGSPFNYSDWQSGQPSGDAQDCCTLISTSGKWGDYYCNYETNTLICNKRMCPHCVLYYIQLL